MLMRFRVANHRSIRDEQELSLVASSLSEHRESLVRAERYDLDLLRVAAVYGANASGKSTVFSALEWMREAVIESHRSWDPGGRILRSTFALDDTGEEPSLYAVDFLLDGVRYEYGFSVDDHRVLDEWLYAYPKGRRQEWFTRSAHREEEFSFSRLLPGENRSISALTRRESLFLSVAAQNNHQMLAPLYQWFDHLLILDQATRAAQFRATRDRCRDDRFRTAVFEILRSADLGLSHLEVLEIDPDGFSRQLVTTGLNERTVKQLVEVMADQIRIQFHHRTAGGGSVPLLLNQESNGTQELFGIAGAMVDALDTGGILVIDELDRSLHPHLAIQIVRMFNDPETNPRNAQLIFNTHDTNLLDTSILRRDQVWFTEKGDDGATRLFPLTDFRARKYENLERGYLQGRYGAVPAVGTPDLRRAVGG